MTYFPSSSQETLLIQLEEGFVTTWRHHSKASITSIVFYPGDYTEMDEDTPFVEVSLEEWSTLAELVSLLPPPSQSQSQPTEMDDETP